MDPNDLKIIQAKEAFNPILNNKAQVDGALKILLGRARLIESIYVLMANKIYNNQRLGLGTRVREINDALNILMAAECQEVLECLNNFDNVFSDIEECSFQKISYQ